MDQAAGAQLARAPVRIAGSDRDAGAITAAMANAERAGVAEDIELVTASISALPAMPGPGLVTTNPPYGVRVGEAAGLRDLYARFGDVLRRTRQGWDVALLSADPRLERELRIPLEERLRTTNGGIAVRLMAGTID